MNSSAKVDTRRSRRAGAESLRLDPGTMVAGYLLGEMLGQGGLAQVYRAEDQQADRSVAVKVFHPEPARVEEFRARVIQASQLVATLRHTNVITVYDAGEHEGRLYIAMRHVEGETLRTLLERQGRLDPVRAMHLLGQVGSALDAAHAHGLIHGDLKPANILLRAVPGGQERAAAFLGDFGLTLDRNAITRHAASSGTVDHLAPEQFEGRAVDGRTDRYALGSLAYQLLAGAAPFRRDDEAGLLRAQRTEAAPPVWEFNAELGRPVHDVFARAMAEDPTQRYPTCAEFLDELGAALGIRPEVGPPGQPAAAETREHPVRTAAAPLTVPHPRGRPGMPAHARTRAARKRLPMRGWVGLVLVAVLAVLLASFTLTRDGDQARLDRFEATELVPFSFDHPDRWNPAGSATNVVFSPAADEILPLFGVGAGDLAGLTDIPGGDLVGMYTYFTSTGYDITDVEGVQQQITQLLPGPVAFGSTDPGASVDGRPALRQDGRIEDPDNDTALAFRSYTVELEGDEPRRVHILYFSAAGSFDQHTDLFDQITGSVRFD